MRLRRQDPETQLVAQVIGFLAALGIGGYLGWILFLAPRETPGSTVASPTAERIEDSAQRPLIVQTTGTPVSSLGGAVRVGALAPDFALPDLAGEMHSLMQHRGQVVILNFWTTWCPPCRLEMPALQQAYERYSDQGFVVLGINLTEIDDPGQIVAYRQELGLTFPILLDLDSEVSEDIYRVLGLPTSVFIDRERIVREVFIGALPLDELESKVQSMMEGEG